MGEHHATGSLTCGADDDRITLGAGGGTIDGSGGTDTVAATDLGGFGFVDVEVLDTADVVGSIAQLMAFATIVNSAGPGIPVSLPYPAAPSVRSAVEVHLTGDGGRLLLASRLADGLDATVMARALASGCRVATAGGDDTLVGSRFADRLAGGAGHDLIDGGRGRDTLVGGAGRDLLHGGAGSDTLRGGAGADIFVYRATGDSTAAAPDTIRDFADTDRIDLSAIDADIRKAGDQAFRFVADPGSAPRPGCLYLDDGLLRADTDGDGSADLVIAIDTGVLLDADHFYL